MELVCRLEGSGRAAGRFAAGRIVSNRATSADIAENGDCPASLASNVRRGPTLWQRFKDKHGDQNRIVNFFLGNHSVATARIRSLNREIALNYRER